MSATTGTWTEVIYNNNADFSATTSTSSEITLLSGINEQPTIPAGFFMNPSATRRVLSIIAKGVLTTTGTPTYTFQVRLSTTQGSSTLSGTSVAASAAITTASGVSNKYWELRLDLTCDIPGQGTNHTTLSGSGYVFSGAGFASPFIYALSPSGGDSATWTATVDGALTQYINVSVTPSAASSSNVLTLKQLLVLGLN
jgi:hypothetical protein